MAVAQREIRQTTVQDGPASTTTREVDDPVADEEHRMNVAARVIWYVAGVVLVLLGLRFVFALLGANSASGIGSFVYGVTAPLVAPFFGVFGYNFTAGQARFEAFTLLAMLIYGLIAWGLARLVTITRHTE